MSRIERARGGCLDEAVKTATLGLFGIETTYKMPEYSRPNLRDVKPGDFIEPGKNTPLAKVLQTGESVIVYSFEPEVIGRKIVINR